LTRLRIPEPLKPERGRSASFDITRAIGPGTYTATLFASRVRNPLHVERSTRYELTDLRDASTNSGVELLATFRRQPFNATASYTYVRSRERTDGESLDIPLTPRHSAGLVGMWENERARIGMEFYYTGRQRLEVNPYRSSSQPYVIIGMLGERRFGHVRIFLNAENLTNVRQSRWDPLLKPTQGPDGRWTVDAWAPLEARVFNGGLRLDF
jgi:outer membrane receptor for ferrienterochelin and colicins